MARSTPWRAILGMPANSRAIQSGAVQFTVTVYLLIRKKAKEYQRFISLVILPYIKIFLNILTNIYAMNIITYRHSSIGGDKVNTDEKRIALIFKAFCDENRVRIIKLLRSGEKCACKILEEIHVTQPTLSHHMKILCDSGIVIGRKEGKWMYYSISSEGIEYAINCLQEITKVSSATEKSCCDK